LEKPVGKFIKHKEKQKRIIGVMKDYHVESLKEEIMPVIHTKEFPFLSYIVVRLEANNIKRSIRTIKRQMENIDLNYVFRYRFLDEHFEKLYKEEKRVNKITVYSAAIAIFIALLGLYALTSFVVIKRRKEIGIRKAMGASVKSIIYKLIKDINKWVLIANLIAWPFVFYFMRSWLENFAYRIDMDLFYFIAGTLLTFIIALTVVGIQAYLAAIENPSETLKDE
jgi:putative ABC transport system permease protein